MSRSVWVALRWGSTNSFFPATLALLATITLLSLLGFADWPHSILRFGLVPARLQAKFGLTLITCVFFHANSVHLAANLIFIAGFAPNIERLTSGIHMLVIFFVSALTASLVHSLVDLQADYVGIGASGGVAGLVTYLTLRQPTATLQWIRLPAWAGLLAAMVIQLIGAYRFFMGTSPPSVFAHTGGALAGMVFWWRSRKSVWHQ